MPQVRDGSREQLIRELAFIVMVVRGLADCDFRRVVPDDEMAHRIRQWHKSAGPRTPAPLRPHPHPPHPVQHHPHGDAVVLVVVEDPLPHRRVARVDPLVEPLD